MNLMHRDERRASTSKRSREAEVRSIRGLAIGLGTGSAAPDYIQLYEGDAKLLSASLQYIQQTPTRILNIIGAGEASAPPV
jgi:hypothetical protein